VGISAKYPDAWAKVKEYSTLIKYSAAQYNVDAELMAAIVIKESSGYPYKPRFEPGFYRKYIHLEPKAKLGGLWPRWTDDYYGEFKERLDRSTSWGHGQIMGQVARELGFDGQYLSELCDPELNLPLMAKFLSFKFKEGSEDGLVGQELRRFVLLRYNGGGDKEYPDSVLAKLIDARRIFG